MNVKFFDWDYLHLTALMKETCPPHYYVPLQILRPCDSPVYVLRTYLDVTGTTISMQKNVLGGLSKSNNWRDLGKA